MFSNKKFDSTSKSLGFELEKKSDVFIVDFTKKPENSRSSFPKGSKILIPPLKIELFKLKLKSFKERVLFFKEIFVFSSEIE